jgi:hypothetical protein
VLLEAGQLDETTASSPPVTVVYEVKTQASSSRADEECSDRTLLEAATGNGGGCTKECPVCAKQVSQSSQVKSISQSVSVVMSCVFMFCHVCCDMKM